MNGRLSKIYSVHTWYFHHSQRHKLARNLIETKKKPRSHKHRSHKNAPLSSENKGGLIQNKRGFSMPLFSKKIEKCLFSSHAY